MIKSVPAPVSIPVPGPNGYTPAPSRREPYAIIAARVSARLIDLKSHHLNGCSEDARRVQKLVLRTGKPHYTFVATVHVRRTGNLPDTSVPALCIRVSP
jgi:hypothetical protein